MTKLLEQWNKSYQESLVNIQNYLSSQENDTDEKKQFRLLANWMMETDINPYQFMPESFANFKSNPYQADATLGFIHHAMLDDGEISFVKMSLEDEVEQIFMTFIWNGENNFIKVCQETCHTLIQTYIESSKHHHQFDKETGVENPTPILTVDDFKFTVIPNAEQFIKEINEFDELNKKRFEDQGDE